jgi:glycosyltransferase involved in cell wall biosynthesis
MQKATWITWETQRRNEELADAFGATYVRIEAEKRNTALRYILCSLWTIQTLFRTRPEVVFAQCPSVVLVALTAVLKPFFGYRLIIDAHNITFEYLEKPRFLLSRLVRFSLRRSNLVLVSNEGLFAVVSNAGGEPLVLPDRLPRIEAKNPPSIWGKGEAITAVTLISSFDPDEPVEEFIQAFLEVSPPARLFVTGRKAKAPQLLRYAGERITFTDYLPRSEYEALISSSVLLVDLTTMDNCLVCGAYEALSVGKPVLLSDSRANREMFPHAMFSANTKEALAAALKRFFSSQITSDVAQARAEFAKKWEEYFVEARKAVFPA